MAKIRIEKCKVVEENLYEIDLTDIIYSIVTREIKNRKVS